MTCPFACGIVGNVAALIVGNVANGVAKGVGFCKLWRSGAAVPFMFFVHKLPIARKPSETESILFKRFWAEVRECLQQGGCLDLELRMTLHVGNTGILLEVQ